MTRNVFIAGLMLALFSVSALAKNIDLVTLPERESVQLTIYNSEDLTLVKETRYITLKKGANKLQFSWANTLIDPTSVELRPLEHADQIEVADTTFPAQKPQHLIWNIESQYEGQVKVEVTYFTSGIAWSMDYVAEVNADETTMKLRGYVRVFNNSGEDYENAEVRLIVGKINLVEKIADLARQYGMEVPEKDGVQYKRMRTVAARTAYDQAGDKLMFSLEESGDIGGRLGNIVAAERMIVKEGLSEYFMFSVEGTESVPNGWSKRMVAVKAEDAKFDIVYRMRAHQYGPQPVRFFILKNDSEHKLGDSPLPDGLVRVFRDNGQGGLSFLGQQQVNYVPVKADIEINLGPDDLVVYESWKMSDKRLNFHFRRSGIREYVDGWDEAQQWTDTIHNYRAKPIAFELQRVWSGDVEYHSETKTDLFDFHTIKATLTVEARSKADYSATITTHNGENAKQSSVKIK